jgi:ribonuclease BN (tRNA processing enzyme)
MKLTILGTGTSTLMRGKAGSAYFIQKQNGGIGIDMRAGVLMRYLDASIDYMNINAIILTHTDHPDHVSDLPMFFFSLNYTKGR